MFSQTDKLKNKHVLLDTCFIIKAYEYSDSDYFNELFFILKENNCVPIISNFIEFEFMKGCVTAEHIFNKQFYIDELSKASFPLTRDELKVSTIISNIYRNKGIKKDIGIVDCSNSAYLKRFNESLLLLTLNHSDYPIVLHDRVHVCTIDTKKELLTLAFYKFNQENFIKTTQDLRKGII